MRQTMKNIATIMKRFSNKHGNQGTVLRLITEPSPDWYNADEGKGLFGFIFGDYKG